MLAKKNMSCFLIDFMRQFIFLIRQLIHCPSFYHFSTFCPLLIIFTTFCHFTNFNQFDPFCHFLGLGYHFLPPFTTFLPNLCTFTTFCTLFMPRFPNPNLRLPFLRLYQSLYFTLNPERKFGSKGERAFRAPKALS